ncbi:hypothetical protein HRbin39_00984 [bacterium HR39]|nr:hypothetical protein HRbin39_00984 [bacterium HR39]
MPPPPHVQEGRLVDGDTNRAAALLQVGRHPLHELGHRTREVGRDRLEGLGRGQGAVGVPPRLQGGLRDRDGSGVRLGTALGDLRHGAGDLLCRRPLLVDRHGNRRGQGVHLLRGRGHRVDGADGAPRRGLDGLHLGHDLVGRPHGLARQRLHLRGHHREAAAGGAGARRLDGGVEGEDRRLLGDAADGGRRLAHARGQLATAADRVPRTAAARHRRCRRLAQARTAARDVLGRLMDLGDGTRRGRDVAIRRLARRRGLAGGRPQALHALAQRRRHGQHAALEGVGGLGEPPPLCRGPLQQMVAPRRPLRQQAAQAAPYDAPLAPAGHRVEAEAQLPHDELEAVADVVDEHGRAPEGAAAGRHAHPGLGVAVPQPGERAGEAADA